MRVLLVFVLACSVAGGRFVDKCELKAQMMEAAKGNQKGLATENFMAKSESWLSFSSETLKATKSAVEKYIRLIFGSLLERY